MGDQACFLRLSMKGSTIPDRSERLRAIIQRIGRDFNLVDEEFAQEQEKVYFIEIGQALRLTYLAKEGMKA